MGNRHSRRPESAAERRARLWNEREAEIKRSPDIQDEAQLESLIEEEKRKLKQEQHKIDELQKSIESMHKEIRSHKGTRDGVQNTLWRLQAVFLTLLVALLAGGGFLLTAAVKTGALNAWQRPAASEPMPPPTVMSCDADTQQCTLSSKWAQAHLAVSEDRLIGAGLRPAAAAALMENLNLSQASVKPKDKRKALFGALYHLLMPKLSAQLVFSCLGLLLGNLGAWFILIMARQGQQQARDQSTLVVSGVVAAVFYGAGSAYWGVGDPLVRIAGGFYILCSIGYTLWGALVLLGWSPVAVNLLCALATAVGLAFLVRVPFGPLVLVPVGAALALYLRSLAALLEALLARPVLWGAGAKEWPCAVALAAFGAALGRLALRLDGAGALDRVYAVRSFANDQADALPGVLRLPTCLHLAAASVLWAGLTLLLAKPFMMGRGNPFKRGGIQEDQRRPQGLAFIGIFIYLASQVLMLLAGLAARRAPLLLFGTWGIFLFELSVLRPVDPALGREGLVERYYHLPHLACSFGLLALADLVREEAYAMFGPLEALGGLALGPAGVLAFSLGLLCDFFPPLGRRGRRQGEGEGEGVPVRTPRAAALAANLALCGLSVRAQREGGLLAGLAGCAGYLLYLGARAYARDRRYLAALAAAGYALVALGARLDAALAPAAAA